MDHGPWYNYDETCDGDEARTLIIHPRHEYPVQVWAMPDQRNRFEDHKLTLVPPHHRKLFDQTHLECEDVLKIPESLKNAIFGCRRCGKAVPIELMDNPCLFHTGLQLFVLYDFAS